MPDIAIPQEEIRRRHRRRWLLVSLAVLIVLVTFGIVWWSTPGGPSVSAKDLLLGRVKKGDFLIQIRSPGTLKPRLERWVTSNVGGTVETLFVHPGSVVQANSPLLQLSNPAVLQQLRRAQLALSRTNAQAAAQKAQLQDQLYAMEGNLASAKAKSASAEMRVKADVSLLKEAVISRLQYETDHLNAQNDAALVASLVRQIAAFRRNAAAQAQGEQSLVASAQADLVSAQENVRALKPLAGMTGEVLTVSVQAGQSLAAGAAMAQIANVHKLDAVLAVSPDDAGETARGQAAEVLLPNPDAPTLQGTVQRISPNVVAAAVPVTIRLSGTLPSGARPQMTVTGVIRVSRMHNVLHVERPVGVEPNSTGSVYVLAPDTDMAIRRKVRFGLASSSGIQILSGLTAGDEIVLSDTSSWGSQMRIR